MKINKYLYISKGKQYCNINTRLTSSKTACKKNEICIKLNLEIDSSIFDELIPSVTLEIPKTLKKTINLRAEY